MQTNVKRIQDIVPPPSVLEINLDLFNGTVFGDLFKRMKDTPQNPMWHGEGDVLTHTEMVCAALLRDAEYQALTRREQEVVFISALFHDIGKTATTVMQDGAWRSPRHTLVGSQMARELLWRYAEMCGTEETQGFREAVCTLIRCHGIPLHLGERADPELELIRIASIGETTPHFSLKLLKILVRADISGRIADDKDELHEKAELAFMLADDLGITEAPYSFPNEITKHAYLSGKSVARDYPLYDDTWGEIILMSGLPGTGKDTWIKKNLPELPVISLDDIRREFNISPTDKEGQGIVISHAKNLAREYLRAKRPFIWNATSITLQLRAAQLELFEKYGARTRIVYLETGLDEELERNRSRTHTVPEAVIYRYISKLEPPLPKEAHRIDWIIT